MSSSGPSSEPRVGAAGGNKVIASLGCGAHEQLLALARRTIEPYARRHGYDLALHTEPVEPTRPAPWSKIRILRDLVDRYDTVVWLDADLVIVDPRVDIASELEDGHVLGLAEHRVGGGRFPNTGVMVLRGGGLAARLLDAAWALDAYSEHRWWENAAICELLGYALDPPRPIASTRWRELTTFMSPRWNWIATAPVRHARIRHFPGFSVASRRLLMRAATGEAALHSWHRR